MNVFCAVRNSFGVVWKNLILVQPFILFLLVFSILSGGLSRVQSSPLYFFIFSTLLLLLIIAFLSGWFYMAKKTIAFEMCENLSPEEKAVKSFGLIKHFLPGVGEYFLPMLGFGIFYLIIFLGVSLCTFKLGMTLIGAPNFDLTAINAAATDAAKLQAYFASLPTEQTKTLAYWFMLVSSTGMLFQFVTTWWLPALFYNTKNPFKALGHGLKFLSKHFLGSICVYFVLGILNFIVSFVNSALTGNIIFALIGLLLFFYYATYYVVLLFLYYGQNGESSTKDYINSGNDCDGQKLAGGESGTED